MCAERLPLQLDQPWARAAFSITAARIRVFNASSSIFSPSWKSMARLVLPSRLELKRPDGSSSAAPLEKVHLHDVLVRLAGADQSVVRPHRNPSPLPLLDHLGVGLLDQCAELGQHLAPPVAQLLDPLVYHPRWRLSFLRPALPHDVSFIPFLLFLATHVRHHRAPTNRDHGSRADSSCGSAAGTENGAATAPAGS